MDMTRWLNDWMARHPLRGPAALDRARFTAEVMARVKTLPQPMPAVRPVHPWVAWPQVRMAVLAATAALAVVVWLRSPVGPREVAWMVERELHTLASLDDLMGIVPGDDDVEALEDELRMVDAILLAEAQPSGQEWIEQTLQLLDELDEEAEVGDAVPLSEEELLRELERLDHQSLAASS